MNLNLARIELIKYKNSSEKEKDHKVIWILNWRKNTDSVLWGTCNRKNCILGQKNKIWLSGKYWKRTQFWQLSRMTLIYKRLLAKAISLRYSPLIFRCIWLTKNVTKNSLPSNVLISVIWLMVWLIKEHC